MPRQSVKIKALESFLTGKEIETLLLAGINPGWNIA
jgi:hypothetical protein